MLKHMCVSVCCVEAEVVYLFSVLKQSFVSVCSAEAVVWICVPW